MAESKECIGGRYILHELLGTGGTGKVYRATDRLTGETVALKRVRLQLETLPSVSATDVAEAEAIRLSIANEFRVLASLRHPGIINVLDYGFDEQHQPFFTMEYLPAARNVLEAGEARPVESQLALIMQMLEALAYLHRRGILHRDLKPGNVLVTGDVVKLLDFGLSISRERAAGTVGSFGYMAPEVVVGAPAGEPSDLYSVGVMAYELLAGKHLFDTSQISRVIQSILYAPPDLEALKADPALVEVIGQLLAKDPARRYPNAEACIAALSAAMGRPIPAETLAIRESFMRAARFVGRRHELRCLTEALDGAFAGRGTAWLVGGESGVGKTRLLDELSTRALVAGAAVVRGHAEHQGGLIYQLWREPLRRLMLTTEVSDLEAGVLQPVVPDIEALLRRDVPPAPPLEGQAGQQRLQSTMADVFCRQKAPLVLVLEDLQWVTESLDVLKQLVLLVHDRALLVVGSFRDDEAPQLPDEMPGAQVIKLDRLSEAEVAELSASMLGEAGRHAEVVHLLQQESEGNTFFLIEVVRALAEEAGRLSDIGRQALPDKVFPRGIQTTVLRRLARVPDEGQALLRLAAVAGRQIDARILGQIAAGPDEVEDWLATCANATVLEMRDGQWRFAHDKLREGLLGTLADGERRDLHRQVAGAIEGAYAGDPDRAAALAYHWGQAGDTGRERHYAALAGRHAAGRFANADAVLHLSRALLLTPESDPAGRCDLLLVREQVLGLLGQREAQAADLAALELLAAGLRDPARQAEVALRQSDYAEVTGDYKLSQAAAEAAIRWARAAGDVAAEAAGYYQCGRGLGRQGDYIGCRRELERALALSRTEGVRTTGRARQVQADSLRGLGSLCDAQGDVAAARGYFEQALELHREIGDRRGEAWVLNNLGVQALEALADYGRARTLFEQSLALCRAIGNRQGEEYALMNLGEVDAVTADYAAARGRYSQALDLARQIGDRLIEGGALYSLGSVARSQGWYVEARQCARSALAIMRELNARIYEAFVVQLLGQVSLCLGDYDGARTALEQALALNRDIGRQGRVADVLSILGLVDGAQGRYETARDEAQEAVRICRELGERRGEGRALTSLGHALVGLGQAAEAADAFRQGAAVYRGLGLAHLMMEPLAALATLESEQGHAAQARAAAAEVLAFLDGGGCLDGAEEPLRVYLACYQVLRPGSPRRAHELLSVALARLQDLGGRIDDEVLRRSFLEAVPYHRAIVQAAAAK